MIPDRWEDIKVQINENFEVLASGTEELEDVPGGKFEFVEFTGPMGKMRFEFISKPKVTGKKTHYSNRIGGEVKVDYEYSPDEIVNEFIAYRYNDEKDEWLESSFDM
jgi:hypothetical protein